MKTAYQVAFVAAAAVAMAGCRTTMVPFTQEMREQNRLSDGELKNLQYYVSHTITLRRELEVGARQVTGNHKLVVIAGKNIEEVVVEAKTPGVCIAVGDSYLDVSFEQGTYLQFQPTRSRSLMPAGGGFATPPDPDPFHQRPSSPPPRGLFSGAYMLWAPSSTVTFMGKGFDALEDTPNAQLLIDAESLERVVKKRKVLPGLVLSNP